MSSKEKEPLGVPILAADASKKDQWWSGGVQFECQGSGKCCVSHGEFGFVYMTHEDRAKAAKLLGIRTAAFTRKYCKMTDGVWHLKDFGSDACVFLKLNRCTIYEARPVQCRTWPFWPEVMGAKAWAKEVKAFCPGVGKGRVVDAQEISANVNEQAAWEFALQTGK